jgi:DNA-binding MarR family transcriptional regulator
VISNSGIKALADFRFALRRFVSFSADAARETGLSPQQHQALLALKAYPPDTEVTVGDLAARLCIRHHSAVGLVRSSRDRRHVHLVLTTYGESLIARLSAAHRDELKRLGPELRRVLRDVEEA